MILDQRLICDLVPRVAEFLDEPLADASIVPTHLLSAFTRRHVTVALGGDGGDELFAGYSTLQAHRLAGYYARIPAVVRRRAIAPVVRRLPVSHNNLSLDFRAKRFVQDAELPLAVRHHRWLGPCSPTEGRALLHPEVGSQLRGRSATDALDEHVGRAAAFDDLSQVLYLDMKLYLESNILPKVDRASMACSLEVRVPLLNTLMLDLLSEERLRRQALFEPGQVKRLIDEHLQKRRDHRMVLWALIVFQLWHERYLVGGSPAGGQSFAAAAAGGRSG
jgi:asparagine synthase (glutamine-hydrolysing)